MSDNYNDWGIYLRKAGWKEKDPAEGLWKDGSELVFDTSTYLEVYDKQGVRLAEEPIYSRNDLEVNYHLMKWLVPRFILFALLLWIIPVSLSFLAVWFYKSYSKRQILI